MSNTLFGVLESIDAHLTTEFAPTTDGSTEVEPKEDVRGETLDGARQEVEQTQDSIENDNDAVAKAVDAIDALESYSSLLTKALENGGVDAYTHQAIRIGVNAITHGKVQLNKASLESIDTAHGRYTATQESIEEIGYAMEGLLDTINDKLKSIWKGLTNLFSRFTDLFKSFNTMAKERKAKLQKESTVMIAEVDSEAVVDFKDMSRLAKDGEINTVKVAKAFDKLKEDFLDKEGLSDYWNRIAALLDSDIEDYREFQRLVDKEGLKLPSGLEDGDVFGLLKQVPVDADAKTLKVTDTIGGVITVPHGENKLSMQISSTAQFTSKNIKGASAPDHVKPLTREQAIEVCDIIIAFTDAMYKASAHFGDAEGRLAKATQMLEARGVNVPAIESFWGDSYQTWKEGNQRFRRLLMLAGISSLTVGVGGIPAILYIGAWLFGFDNELRNKVGLKQSSILQFIGVGTTFWFSYPIAMLITLARGSKNAPKEVQEEYDNYVMSFNKASDEEKKYLPNPADVDAARKLVEDKEAQRAFNKAIAEIESNLIKTTEDYFMGYSHFAFGIADQAFPIMLRHVDASIQ